MRSKTGQLASGLVLSLVPALIAHAALPPSVSDEFNGRDAPAFSLSTIDGSQVTLASLKGRPLLMSFFASWCPPCRKEIGQLTALHQKYAARGLAIVGAAVDSKLLSNTPAEQEKSDVAAIVQRLSIPYPVGIASQKLAEDFHFKGIPTTIVVGADGKIVKTFYGYHDGAKIEAIVQQILAQR